MNEAPDPNYLVCTRCGSQFKLYNANISLCGDCYFGGFKGAIQGSSQFTGHKQDQDVLRNLIDQPVAIGIQSTGPAWPQEKPMPNNSFKMEQKKVKHKHKKKDADKIPVGQGAKNIPAEYDTIRRIDPDLKNPPQTNNYGQMGSFLNPSKFARKKLSEAQHEQLQRELWKARYRASPITTMPDKRVKKLKKTKLVEMLQPDKSQRTKEYEDSADNEGPSGISAHETLFSKYRFHAMVINRRSKLFA